MNSTLGPKPGAVRGTVSLVQSGALSVGLLIVIWCVWTGALQPDLPTQPPGVSVGQQEIWEDIGGGTTWENIQHGAASFSPVGAAGAKYGYRSSAFWMRLTVANHTETARQLYVSVAGVLLDDLRSFVVGRYGQVQMSRTGAAIPAAQRPVPEAARLMLLPFRASADETLQVYLRMRTTSADSSFPVQIIDEGAARADADADQRSHGVLLGIFSSLFAYNVVLWLLLREQVYLIYITYLASTFVTSSLWNGNAETFLYPHLTWPTMHLLVPVGSLAGLSMLMFTRRFLRTKDHPWLDTVLRLLAALSLMLGVSGLFLPQLRTVPMLLALSFVMPFMSVLAGVVAQRAGKKEARFYLAGHGCTIATLVVFFGLNLGFLPVIRATAMAFSYGTAADAVLLAFALADRIRVLQQARRQAERCAQAALASRAVELERLVKERTAEIEWMALTDSLTGAANRHGFERATSRIEEMAALGTDPCAVLMIDLDCFKSINDRFGHDEGDRVLRDTARTISALIHIDDVFSRLGGEEFVIVSLGTSRDQALALAERIRVAIASSIAVDQPQESVTVSIGVAIGSAGKQNQVNVLRRQADEALYRAKELGRNRVILAPDEHSNMTGTRPSPVTPTPDRRPTAKPPGLPPGQAPTLSEKI